MQTFEDNLKIVLNDLVVNGSTWDEAYAELIRVCEENTADLYT
jgi:hypothetical protein